jgi:hypothetical protein
MVSELKLALEIFAVEYWSSKHNKEAKKHLYSEEY